MDKLDQHIAEKESELDELEARQAVLRAELDALRLAASLRPASASSPARKAAAASPPKGRTKGAISKVWRGVLAEMYSTDTYLTYEEIHEIALRRGNDVALGSVRDRVRSMLKTGLLEGDAEAGFCVTDEAADRFEFAQKNEPPEGGSETEGGATPSDPGVIPGMFTNAVPGSGPAPHSGGEGGD